MKKLYILFFALIAALSANADYYLAGDGNNWNGGNGWKFTDAGGGKYTLQCSRMWSGYNFKINDGSWNDGSTFGGDGTKLSPGVEYTKLKNPGSNIEVDGYIQEPYIEFYPSSKKILIIDKAAPKSIPSNLYIQSNLNNWNNQGLKMNRNGNTYTYDFSIASAGDYYFQFSLANGSDWNAVNTNDRYGSAKSDGQYTLGNKAKLTYYALNNEQGACQSYKVNLQPGKYTVTVDFSDLSNVTMQIAVKKDPVVTLKSATGDAGELQATLNYGKIEVENGNPTSYKVVFTCSTNANFSKTVNSANPDGGSVIVTGMEADKTYSYSAKAIATIDGAEVASSSITFTVKPTAATLKQPTITINDHSNDPMPNGKERGAKYFTCVITNHADNPDATIYYTIDGKNPEAVASQRYKGEFQIPGNCEIHAISVEDNVQSSMAIKAHAASVTFGWEGSNEAEQRTYMRVRLDDPKEGYGNFRILKANISDDDESISYGDEATSAFSWAKFFDKKESEALVATNRDFYMTNSDHLYGTGNNAAADEAVRNAYTPNVDQNDTNVHIPRNFVDSYYRVYIHSDAKPSLVNGPSGAPRRANGDGTDTPSTSTWDSNSNTAGNVDPFATSRIAYTAEVRSNETTGVEDITSEANDEFDPDAPVVYYNLQGVQVQNPEHGIYIRVQGKKVTKVYVK